MNFWAVFSSLGFVVMSSPPAVVMPVLLPHTWGAGTRSGDAAWRDPPHACLHARPCHVLVTHVCRLTLAGPRRRNDGPWEQSPRCVLRSRERLILRPAFCL